MIGVFALQSVDLGLLLLSSDSKDCKYHTQTYLPFLTRSTKQCGQKSQEVCLLCYWGRHLTSFIHLLVEDM